MELPKKSIPIFLKTDFSSKPKEIFAPTCNYFPLLGSIPTAAAIYGASFASRPNISEEFFPAKKWVWKCLNLEVKRWNSEVFQGRVCRKANGSGSREREEVAAAADKKIERTQDIHQLFSASQTFQIFEPLNIDILPKGYSWTQEHKRKGKVWKGSCSLARTIVDFFRKSHFSHPRPWGCWEHEGRSGRDGQGDQWEPGPRGGWCQQDGQDDEALKDSGLKTGSRCPAGPRCSSLHNAAGCPALAKRSPPIFLKPEEKCGMIPSPKHLSMKNRAMMWDNCNHRVNAVHYVCLSPLSTVQCNSVCAEVKSSNSSELYLVQLWHGIKHTLVYFIRGYIQWCSIQYILVWWGIAGRVRAKGPTTGRNCGSKLLSCT